MTAQGIWELRYRNLEEQFEYLLRNVAAGMAEIEEAKGFTYPPTQAASGPRILKIVRAIAEAQPYICCVATGSNMEYKFRLFSSGKVLLDTKYSRLNSVALSPNVDQRVDHCEVFVKSDSDSGRIKVSSRVSINGAK